MVYCVSHGTHAMTVPKFKGCSLGVGFLVSVGCLFGFFCLWCFGFLFVCWFLGVFNKENVVASHIAVNTVP